jgi:hypothetical protein
MRDKIKRLERALRGTREAIPQRDGSTYYFDPEEVVGSIFMYWAGCMRADYHRRPRPQPPEAFKAVARAKNRREALDRVMGGFWYLPIDEEALCERGEFEPKLIAPSHPPIARPDEG